MVAVDWDIPLPAKRTAGPEAGVEVAVVVVESRLFQVAGVKPKALADRLSAKHC